MKFQSAIDRLKKCKSWDEYEGMVAYFESWLVITPKLTDADWDDWSAAKDKARRRLSELLRAG